MHTINIAVLMGGYSTEHEISLQSGATVMAALDPERYNVYAVHIRPSGWVVIEDGEERPIHRADFSFTSKDGHDIHFEACYNTIHGTPGEDGKLQAYLELIGIPQTSAPHYQSALTFNKRDTLSVLKPYGIPMARSVYFNKGQELSMEFKQGVATVVGYPCFVKPSRAGSSYGVSKVYKEGDLETAIQEAFKEDDEILIESFLSGSEVSVGVFDFGEGIQVLPVCEIIPSGDFFDLESKYSGTSQEIVPARLSTEDTQKVQELTRGIYELLNLKGICRIDFIFHQGTPHFVEVNTNPGLSKESIVPKQLRANGLTLRETFGKAIAFALQNK